MFFAMLHGLSFGVRGISMISGVERGSAWACPFRFRNCGQLGTTRAARILVRVKDLRVFRLKKRLGGVLALSSFLAAFQAIRGQD
jgi:hypothetical protein